MIEANLSIKDFCTSCGHYHYPIKSKKDVRRCTAGAANGGDCRCTPTTFTARKFKGAYA